MNFDQLKVNFFSNVVNAVVHMTSADFFLQFIC
jgi:hypothetical protein